MAGLKLFALLAALVVVMYVQQSSCFETQLEAESAETQLEAQSTEVQDEQGDENAHCRCHGYSCYCCQRIRFKKWRLRVNINVCVKVTYLRRNFGFRFAVTVNRRTVFSKSVSARNPPRFCFGVPGLSRIVGLCVRFYNLRLSRGHLSMCVQVQATVLRKVIKRVRIGCFKIPPRAEDIEMPAIDSDALKFLTENNLNLRDIVLEAIKQAGPEIFNSPEKFNSPEIEDDVIEDTEEM